MIQISIVTFNGKIIKFTPRLKRNILLMQYYGFKGTPNISMYTPVCITEIMAKLIV